MLVGRETELQILNKTLNSKASKLVCIYGRRRVGKSTLIFDFAHKSKLGYLLFEGLENENTQEQIQHFLSRLSEQLNDEFITKLNLKTWDEVFKLLTEKFIARKNKQKKIIISFDEIQWMAAKKGKLISLIKYFWDNHWKDKNIILILCGSIASYMVDKVINSKALYGRIDHEILLRQLNPKDSVKFFKGKRSKEEILKYMMLFGSIPKYLEIIDINSSFKKNMEYLCFSSEGFMVNEFEKIFYSQFKEAKNYLRIVEMLQDRLLTAKEIENKLKIGSGGGLQRYINNLEAAQMISSYEAPKVISKSSRRKYKLTDEYLCFFFKYIKPNLQSIKKPRTKNLYTNLCESKWQSWLGFAFERFVLNNAMYFAELMGFANEVIDYSPYFGIEDQKYQIDLLYVRADRTITVCEIKFYDKAISTLIIPEFEKKLVLLPKIKGYSVDKALISLYGPDPHLSNTNYFDYSISLAEMFQLH